MTRPSRGSPLWVNVVVRGPLFSKKIDAVVKRALIAEVLEKIEVRLKRGGKGMGAKRNIVTAEMAFGHVAAQAVGMEVKSTKKYPRTKGTAWVSKNVAIARAMAPRVLRKAARRMVGELN